MTTITVPRAVLEKALEALEKITAFPKNFWDLEEEITALRAALAQEEQQEQEPVAWQWLNTAHFRKKLPANAESGAWNPLYTTPPRREWRSLSEEEINETLDNNLEGGTSLFDICRAIEQALKEKNT
jgi:hypothetical protein